MKTEEVPVKCERISEVPNLDPIFVFWLDVQPSVGQVTITCYGQAWTSYFNAMSGCTIREFFAKAPADYLTNSMGIHPHISSKRTQMAYLRRIIEAVKASIKDCAVIAICPHDRLNEDGICRACGEDCRSGS